MESDIGNFLDKEILPKAYPLMDAILPEFDFTMRGNNWISCNKLRVTGREGHKTESVYIYQNTPYLISDHSEGAKSLTVYLKESPYHSPNDYIGVVKYLADKVGVSLPEITFTPEDIEASKKKERSSSLLEETQSFLLKCLQDNKSNTLLSDFLSKRGYLDVADKMGLGHLPSKRDLFNHLNRLDFSDSEITDSLKLNHLVGDTHKLSIPWRDSYGRLIGLAWRDINHKDGDPKKYLMPNEFKRGDYLFNQKALTGDKDLVIVEGILDPLYCEVHGLSNIVALVGAQITSNQVKEAIRFGAKKITLCLDSDERGQEGTDKAIDQLLETGEDIRLYVATLPEGFKDPDELIKVKGIEAFKEVVANAQRYYEYKLDKLSPKEGERPKEVDTALDSLGLFLNKIREDDKETFIARLKDKLGPLGISIQKVYQKEKERKASEKLAEITLSASRLAKEGNTQEAISLLGNIGKHLNTGVSFHELLEPITEALVRDRLTNFPESISSGIRFEINGEIRPLEIPSGAITIVAGPTGHGKTTLLLNTALNIIESYPDKKVHIFTYEESKEAVVIKALNTYLGMEISANNRKSLTEHFKNGRFDYFKSESKDTVTLGEFKEKKERFFNLFASGRLRIHYVNYHSEDLISSIRFFKDKGDIDIALIDYMQLLKLPEAGKLSRQEELKEVCLSLKDLAVDTGLPLILGAQFNREVKSQEDLLATRIREAGDIEQVANLVLGLWNDFESRTIHLEVLKGRDIGAGYSTLLEFNGNHGKIYQNITEGEKWEK